MNIQARFINSSWWFVIGKVTHVEAALQLAERFDKPGLIEVAILTRYQPTDERPDPPIFEHRVTRRVVFDVVPLRGDEK